MSLIQRLKPLGLSVALAASLWTAPVLAAGTTPLSLAIQYDTAGNLAPGCKLTFFVAGTAATLQNVYADFGLTTPISNPLTCDQSGRVPQHWLADGLIHIQLTDSAGLPIIDTTMQVLGPSSGGGGGGGTVDPTAIMSTGDLKVKYATGALAGFVRTNGLTIGNATSGATERANADAQPLFIFLYNCGDATLVVSGGRTGNALNDFNAGKTITVPNYSGRALAALDNQGAGAAGVLSTAFYGTNPALLGAAGGAAFHNLLASEVPTINVSGLNSISVSGSGTVNSSGSNTISAANAAQSITVTVPGSGASRVPYSSNGDLLAFSATGGGAFVSQYSAGNNWAYFGSLSGSNSISVSGTNTINVSGSAGFTSTGSNTITAASTNTGSSAFATVTPSKLATIYMKL